MIWTTFKFNVNCQVTSHYSIFKQLSVYSTDRLSNSLDSLTNRSVLFNLAQVWDLSNFVLNFFQTFLFQPPSFAFQRFAAWGLIYHSFEICQTLFQTFLKVFFAALPLTLAVFCGVRFNIPQIFNLSNFVLNFFQTFLSAPSPRAPARLATGL